MAILKGKADAGQGGKRGHSNMDHWEFNEEIKEFARKRRRLSAKVEISQGLIEHTNATDDEVNKPTDDEFSQ